MSLTVNTNIASLTARRSLYQNSNDLAVSMQRLSTGLRINTAGDDAAGLGLAQKIKSQVSSSDIAKNNAQTGINLIQTAEADLSQIQEIMQRMRDLSVQASNGVYSSSELGMLNSEFTSLRDEIDRIANSSKFSDKKLLDGSWAATALQVGTNNSTDDQISLSATLFRDFNLGSAQMPAVAANIATQALAQPMIDTMTTAITTISTSRAQMGAMINRLQATISRIDTRKENMQASLSVIIDADIAQEAASMTRGQILKQTAISILQQANQEPQMALALLR